MKSITHVPRRPISKNWWTRWYPGVGFLSRGAAFAATAFVMSAGGVDPLSAFAGSNRFGFEAVPANTLDTITAPKGYNWHVVARWGDSMWTRAPEFDHATRGTGASQELAFGDNNDGMSLFSAGDKNILAVNNEYVNVDIIHGGKGGGRPKTADDVRKSKAAHGVSVMEIEQKNGKWSIVKDSPYNRKVTPDTPMDITGPARGHALMKTAADPQWRALARHLEQLRKRRDALGHVSHV